MIKFDKKNNATKIGIFFALCTIGLSATVVVPILYVVPGALIEQIASGFVSNVPYSNVAKLTIAILAGLFLIVFAVNLSDIKRIVLEKGTISNKYIIIVMVVLSLIVQPLGLYIYWGVSLNFRSDGQLIFLAIISVPITGLSFIPIGSLIDIVKNYAMEKFEQNNPTPEVEEPE